MRSEDGFSLVEVLCAVTVAALGLVMLMQMHTASLQLGGRLDAENAIRRMASARLALGETGAGRQDGVAWQVERQVAAGDATSGLKLIRENLRVSGPSGARLVLSRLVLEGAR